MSAPRLPSKAPSAPARTSSADRSDQVAFSVRWENLIGLVLFALTVAVFQSANTAPLFDVEEVQLTSVATTTTPAERTLSAERNALACKPSEKAAAEALLFRPLSAEERGNVTCFAEATNPSPKPVAKREKKLSLWRSMLLYLLAFFGQR